MARPDWSGDAGTINDPIGVKTDAAKGHAHDDDTNTGLLRFAEIAGRSFVNSAIQEPWHAVAQLGDKVTSKLGFNLPEFHLVTAPKAAKAGSSDWFAETLGSGLGMVAPFLASDAMLSKAGDLLGSTRYGSAAMGLATKLPYSDAVAPFMRPAMSGAAYGFLFTPSDPNSHNNILVDRAKNAVVGAVTFPIAKLGTEAAAGGLVKGLTAAGVDTTSSLASQIAVRGTGSLMGGATGGFANAETSSYVNTGHTASRDEVAQSMAAFMVTGGALEGINALGSYRGRGRQAEVPPEGPLPGTDAAPKPQEPAGHDVGMGDFAKRAEGVNGERPNSPAMVQSSIDLGNAVARKLDLHTESDLANSTQWKDFSQLIEKTLAREHMEGQPDAGQLAGVMNATTRLLGADKLAVNLTDGQRLGLAKQILAESLQPRNVANPNWGAPVSAIHQTLVGHVPGKVADSVVGFLQTGKFQSTLERPVSVDLSADELSKAPKIYRSSLVPDSTAANSLNAAQEAGAPPAVEGERSYYGQLGQLLAMNIHGQTHPDGRFLVVTNETSKEPQFLKADNSGNYRPATDGSFSPWLSTAEMQRIYDHVSGVANESLALKNGNPLLITDLNGSVPGAPGSKFGLYVEDTRYLSKLDYLINGNRPEANNSDVRKGYAGIFTYTTPDGIKVTRQTVINDGIADQLQLKNTTSEPQTVHLSVGYGSDFADMFTVRGYTPKNKVEPLAPILEPERGTVTLSYDGRDNLRRQTGIQFKGETPNTLTDQEAGFVLTIAPGETKNLDVQIATRREAIDPNKPTPVRPMEVTDRGSATDQLQEADAGYAKWRDSGVRITSANPQLNAVLERAWRSLYMLRHPGLDGGNEAIDAGVPWFASPFGRDSLITSFQMLPFKPEIARGVLKMLADNQGTVDDPTRVEKPGKIMHELRLGEIARTGELPFNPYYGTVDATPLWLMLVGRYVEATGDTSLLKELKPNIDAALKYLDGETNKSGYLAYGGDGSFLSNQGWKDSGNSIVNSKGELAKQPITLSEPQGYLYAAWREAAKLASLDGDTSAAERLNAKADDLKERFNKDFWMPDKNFAALAIDGQGRQADVISSNPGHLLFSGLLTPEHAFAVHDRMLQPDMNSGFGFHTLASGEVAYQPYGYHLGSVWAHDSAMALYGMHDLKPGASLSVLSNMADAALMYPNMSLPELFGGYARSEVGQPVPYPVACDPQAWAAGALFQSLGANLGLHPLGLHNELLIFKPTLPDNMLPLQVDNVRIGDKTVNLTYRKENGQVVVDVDNPQGVKIHFVPNDTGPI